MKCPHCQSHMDNYQSSKDDRCQVQFYRCTVCDGESVASSMVPSEASAKLHLQADFSSSQSQFAQEFSV